MLVRYQCLYWDGLGQVYWRQVITSGLPKHIILCNSNVISLPNQLPPAFKSPLHWRHNDHGGVSNHQESTIHYGDVITSQMAFRITSLTIIYSTVYSGADQRKHQSSASLAFVRGIHRWPVNSPHKWPVTRKMFPFDDVIMISYQNRKSHYKDKTVPRSSYLCNGNPIYGKTLLYWNRALTDPLIYIPRNIRLDLVWFGFVLVVVIHAIVKVLSLVT